MVKVTASFPTPERHLWVSQCSGGSLSPCYPSLRTCWPWGLQVFSSGGKECPHVGVGCSGALWPHGCCRLLCCHRGETPSQPWHVHRESPPHAATTTGSGCRFYIFLQVSYSHIFFLRQSIYVYVHTVYVQRLALCTQGAKVGAWDPLAYPRLHQHIGHR